MSAARHDDAYYVERIAAYRDSDEAAPKAIVQAWDSLAEFLNGSHLVGAMASIVDKYESRAAGGRSG